jgi:hypothetical protein
MPRIAWALVTGTALGAIILGVGGRLAMAGIALTAGSRPHFTLGGTITVIALGAVSGLAGAVIALGARAVRNRWMPQHAWLQHTLFAVLLLAITLRGLHGTAPIARWFFLPLVAVYGVALTLFISRDASGRRSDTSAEGQR